MDLGSGKNTFPMMEIVYRSNGSECHQVTEIVMSNVIEDKWFCSLVLAVHLVPHHAMSGGSVIRLINHALEHSYFSYIMVEVSPSTPDNSFIHLPSLILK